MKHVETDAIQFETMSSGKRLVRNLLVNPMINYILPRSLLRGLVARRSALLDACVREPGSWECMRLSYEPEEPRGHIDRVVQKYGTIPTALRNRKRLVTTILGQLISQYNPPVHIVGVAAGTGHNVMEGMLRAPDTPSFAYLVDLSDGATSFGQQLAQRLGLADRAKFISGNVLEIERLIDVPADITVAVGILEYLTDEQTVELAKAMYRAAPPGGAFLANSILPTHGSDRFLRTVMHLHVQYREPSFLCQLLGEANYGDFTVHSEPLGMYSIVVGFKR
jgi:hypothetical protein